MLRFALYYIYNFIIVEFYFLVLITYIKKAVKCETLRHVTWDSFTLCTYSMIFFFGVLTGLNWQSLSNFCSLKMWGKMTLIHQQRPKIIWLISPNDAKHQNGIWGKLEASLPFYLSSFIKTVPLNLYFIALLCAYANWRIALLVLTVNSWICSWESGKSAVKTISNEQLVIDRIGHASLRELIYSLGGSRD